MTWAFGHLVALIAGFALDALLGDPHDWSHPVRAMGALIAAAEKALRRVFPPTPGGLRAAGVVLVVLVAGASTAAASATLWLLAQVSPYATLAGESVMCYQLLAARSLRDESTTVQRALEADDLLAARAAVAMIVGRDTAALDEAGVTRAAVETVAENASDGVVAPLLFMALGGAPAGALYKAVNTMDSMVGYRNERYRDFGWAAARADDMLNFIPARVAGALMCLVAPLAGLDGRGAWRIFRRDRRKHASPNSAQTESACAGALGVALAGPASYFGRLVDKPWIGDAARAIEPADIARANRLMYATAVAALVLALAVGVAACAAARVAPWQ